MAFLEDKEMAEEYVDTILDKDDAELDKFLDEYLGDLKLNKKQAGAILGIIKGVGICSYLAGLEAGRPKWHKPSEKLPAECSLVLAFDFDDSEPALFKFVTSDTWEWMPRRIAFLSNDQIKCWCEIPKYTGE